MQLNLLENVLMHAPIKIKFKGRVAVARLEQKIFKHDLLENQILFIRLEEDDKFPSELNGLIAMQLSPTL